MKISLRVLNFICSFISGRLLEIHFTPSVTPPSQSEFLWEPFVNAQARKDRLALKKIELLFHQNLITLQVLGPNKSHQPEFKVTLSSINLSKWVSLITNKLLPYHFGKVSSTCYSSNDALLDDTSSPPWAAQNSSSDWLDAISMLNEQKNANRWTFKYSQASGISETWEKSSLLVNYYYIIEKD